MSLWSQLQHHAQAALVAASASLMLASPASAVEYSSTHPAKGSLQRYTAPDGVTSMAVGLTAPALPAAALSTQDLVILVDTSASQVGEHRTHAHAVLAQTLKRLPQGSRAAVFALDVQVKPMSEGFVQAGGDFSSALENLTARAPLGATNLPKGIRQALSMQTEGRSLSVIYIGDGMSTARLVQSDEARELMGSLRDNHIPLHSCAIGPKTDLQLLGMLALRSGGIVIEDEVQGNTRPQADSVAAKLTAALATPVFYPDSVDADGVSLLPSEALPIRSDRETVYLARATDGTPRVVTASGSIADRNITLKWDLSTSKVQKGDSYLAALADSAAKSDGLTNALAGQNLLKTAQDEFSVRLARLAAQGERAIALRQWDDARAFGEGLELLDPNNPQAAAILKVVNEEVALLQPEGTGNLIDRAVRPSEDEQVDRIRSVVEREQIITELMVQDTVRAIQAAKATENAQPGDAINIIKDQIATIANNSEMNASKKQELLRTLRTEQQRLVNKRDIIELKRTRIAEARALAEARRSMIEEMQLEEQKITQLTDQVRALISEGRHGEPDAFERAEEVSEELVSMRPGNAIGAATFFNSEASGQLDKFFRLRALRADRFLETLYQVELSHVPFPDEPPVQWPPANVWRELTERRAKWAAVDLHEASPAERKIEEALSQTTEFDFIDNPFNEAIDFLADLHRIQIVIQTADLEADGVQTDTPITLALSGITLRSALRLILEDLGLTYYIEDEVMKITTITAIENDFDRFASTRVYPVGDLVIPIVTPQTGGGGQGGGLVGGGQGGFGGNQGGFGGGGFGGGGFGGGGGGFGGGGGGGFFSVAPQRFAFPQNRRPRQGQPAQQNAPAVRDAEVKGLLDGILGPQSSVAPVEFQAFAQVNDDLPFRLDNKTIRDSKKKPMTTR